MRYLILFPGNEATWEDANPDDHQRVEDRHAEFGTTLREAGHIIRSAGALTHSREAKVIRAKEAGHVTITDGPFAETVEQITGFYDVETTDPDGLFQIVGIVAGPDHGRAGMGAVEIRPVEEGE